MIFKQQIGHSENRVEPDSDPPTFARFGDNRVFR
jgi:hypothetical protein